ncbi:MAG: hypothetical protein ACHREM_32655, partial [Polyangiales bacterium]
VQSACGRLADALLASDCYGWGFPTTAEVARERPLLVRSCANLSALPGSSFNAQAIGARVVQVRSSCDYTRDLVPSPGALPNGTACANDVQCVSAWCDTPVGGCGTCRAMVPLGGDCSQAACAYGTVCDPLGLTCSVQARAGDGMHCDSNVLQCSAELSCDPASSTCVAPPATRGAGCNAPVGCASPLHCVAGACGDLLPEGAACTGLECAPGLHCDASSQTCGAHYRVGPGEACSANDGPACAVGFCSGTRCPAILANGAACTDGSATSTCDVGSWCVNGVCRVAYADACN